MSAAAPTGPPSVPFGPSDPSDHADPSDPSGPSDTYVPPTFWRALIDGSISLIYPARCASCGKPCDSGTAICTICRCSIERPIENEVLDSIKEFFPDSRLAHAWALWVFEKPGALQRVHRAVKYNNQPYLGFVLGRLLGSLVAHTNESFDCIVCVPLHKTRLYERGYNQCTAIAGGVAVSTGIVTNNQLLTRSIGTRTQTRLPARARAENLRNAFVATSAVAGQSILVVDDIITSGATVSAAASALFDAGASAVGACAVGFARR